MLSLTRRCPFHLIYKRETQGAKRRARLCFAATTVLIIAGAVVPACVTGIMHQRAHERSQQAELALAARVYHEPESQAELGLNIGGSPGRAGLMPLCTIVVLVAVAH